MPPLSNDSDGTARRQSCDRCHGQKLRCLRSPNANSGACERCIRSKAQCVYSSSLPKGRPSLYRLNSQCPKATSTKRVPASSGSQEISNDSSGQDAGNVLVEMSLAEESHSDKTNTVTWRNTIPLDWMDSDIDSTITDSEQWLFDLQHGAAARATMDSDNFVDHAVFSPSQLPSFTGNGFVEQFHEDKVQKDSVLSTISKRVGPESAIARLSHLSTRLYRLHNEVVNLASTIDALDQYQTASLPKAPFVSDSAFQMMARWLVHTSFNVDLFGHIECQNEQPGLEQKGCTILQDIFSASHYLLDILHSLNDKVTPSQTPMASDLISSNGLGNTVPSMPATPKSMSATRGTENVSYSNLDNGFRASGHWSGPVVRHMVIACHTLLLNIYLAMLIALQHETDKNQLSDVPAHAHSAALGDVRMVVVVQLCGFLTKRQSNVAQTYLASLNPSPSGLEQELFVTSSSSPSDQMATKELEANVEQRLARLRQSLYI